MVKIERVLYNKSIKASPHAIDKFVQMTVQSIIYTLFLITQTLPGAINDLPQKGYQLIDGFKKNGYC